MKKTLVLMLTLALFLGQLIARPSTWTPPVSWVRSTCRAILPDKLLNSHSLTPRWRKMATQPFTFSISTTVLSLCLLTMWHVLFWLSPTRRVSTRTTCLTASPITWVSMHVRLQFPARKHYDWSNFFRFWRRFLTNCFDIEIFFYEFH